MSPASRSRSASRPRWMRDLTVPRRDARHVRDLLVVVALHVEQHDGGTLVGHDLLRAAAMTLLRFAVATAMRSGLSDGSVGGCQLSSSHSGYGSAGRRFLDAQGVRGGVERDARQPAAEQDATKSGQVPVRARENASWTASAAASRIPRARTVTAEQVVLVQLDEPVEGVELAAERGLDQGTITASNWPRRALPGRGPPGTVQRIAGRPARPTWGRRGQGRPRGASPGRSGEMASREPISRCRRRCGWPAASLAPARRRAVP